MLDDDRGFYQRFIVAVRAPIGRKPLKRRLVLEGIFLELPHQVVRFDCRCIVGQCSQALVDGSRGQLVV